MSLVRGVLLVAASLVLTGCTSPAPRTAPLNDPLCDPVKAPINVPSYEVKEERDVSFPGALRFSYRIIVAGDLTEDQVLAVAGDLVAKKIAAIAINAITFLFYKTGTPWEGIYTKASVDWAPSGQWAKADTVQAGDYSRHCFLVGGFIAGGPSSSPPSVPAPSAGTPRLELAAWSYTPRGAGGSCSSDFARARLTIRNAGDGPLSSYRGTLWVSDGPNSGLDFRGFTIDNLTPGQEAVVEKCLWVHYLGAGPQCELSWKENNDRVTVWESRWFSCDSSASDSPSAPSPASPAASPAVPPSAERNVVYVGAFRPRELEFFLDFAWSPTASSLAILNGDSIAIYSVPTKTLERTLYLPDVEDFQWNRLTWSKTGAFVVFGEAYEPFGQTRYDLLVLDANGNLTHRLDVTSHFRTSWLLGLAELVPGQVVFHAVRTIGLLELSSGAIRWNLPVGQGSLVRVEEVSVSPELIAVVDTGEIGGADDRLVLLGADGSVITSMGVERLEAAILLPDASGLVECHSFPHTGRPSEWSLRNVSDLVALGPRGTLASCPQSFSPDGNVLYMVGEGFFEWPDLRKLSTFTCNGNDGTKWQPQGYIAWLNYGTRELVVCQVK